MKRLGIGFQISILIHGALIACFIGLQRYVSSEKPSRPINLAILSILPGEGALPGPSEFSGPGAGSPPPQDRAEASEPLPPEHDATAEAPSVAQPWDAAPWEAAETCDTKHSAQPDPPEAPEYIDAPWEFASRAAPLPKEYLSAVGDLEMPVKVIDPPPPKAPEQQPRRKAVKKPVKKKQPPKAVAAKKPRQKRKSPRKKTPAAATARPAASESDASALKHADAGPAKAGSSAAGQKSPGGTPSTAPGSPAGSGPGSEDQYLKANYGAIHSRLSRCLNYPKIARKRGWSGRVLVAFTVLPDGRVECPTVRESCGIALLDKSAVQTVQAASPFPRPGSILKIVVPVVFRLES